MDSALNLMEPQPCERGRSRSQAQAWQARFFTQRDGRAEGGVLPGLHRAVSFPHWHHRGYLPHFDIPGRVQMVSYRLGDAVPQSCVARWRNELGMGAMLVPMDDPKQVELRRRIVAYEDAGYGACQLRLPEVARIVQDSLLHHDGQHYRLLAWCVMPNHVHVLLEMEESHALGDQIKSWKVFTAKAINHYLGRTGPLWQVDYYDRCIRDAKHLAHARDYIENNPVKARLCLRTQDWPFCHLGIRDESRLRPGAQTATLATG